MKIRLPIAFAVSGLAIACSTAPAPTATTTAPAPRTAGVPADDGLNAVVWTQRAVERDLVFREVYRDARGAAPRRLFWTRRGTRCRAESGRARSPACRPP